jgi:hypothetical protein
MVRDEMRMELFITIQEVQKTAKKTKKIIKDKDAV